MLMSSGKRKNGVDACAKKAALLFVACERNPDPTAGRLSIPNVLRVKEYSEDGMTDGRLVGDGASSSMAAVTPPRELTAPAPAATAAKEKKPSPSRRLFSFAKARRMA